MQTARTCAGTPVFSICCDRGHRTRVGGCRHPRCATCTAGVHTTFPEHMTSVGHNTWAFARGKGRDPTNTMEAKTPTSTAPTLVKFKFLPHLLLAMPDGLHNVLEPAVVHGEEVCGQRLPTQPAVSGIHPEVNGHSTPLNQGHRSLLIVLHLQWIVLASARGPAEPGADPFKHGEAAIQRVHKRLLLVSLQNWCQTPLPPTAHNAHLPPEALPVRTKLVPGFLHGHRGSAELCLCGCFPVAVAHGDATCRGQWCPRASTPATTGMAAVCVFAGVFAVCANPWEAIMANELCDCHG